ncbi:MAG: hypothetical protein HN919_22315 [Verrucomicrobia bacterium]|jgi:hypothetical protein|nr:hypothetical protein [Verrucomicrobiota bacterium]MBT7069047.1 hypothetical protein [Verrucomicrobiota bacterium]MBT7702218.1 hypothetical protein [Verrucomicrobiota bacterium]
MDLGVFRRKKATFWAWIVLPALCVIVGYQVMHVYCLYVEERLERRQAVLSILDDVEQCMNVSKDVVLGFAMMGDRRTPAAEDVSSRISELARRHDFMVNSLHVNESRETGDESSRALEIDLKGEGDILSLMQFLNELQSPQHLTVIDGASLHLKQRGAGTAASYTTELTVRCVRDALQGGNDV